MRKYRNQPTEINGYTFDSRAEAARYQELALLERGGEISALEIHPCYTLQEAFRDASGKRWRAITYEADFAYMEGARRVVEDVKSEGTITDVFRIKEKLFRHRYPDLDFRIIDA